jgi:hypothetical protein
MIFNFFFARMPVAENGIFERSEKIPAGAKGKREQM